MKLLKDTPFEVAWFTWEREPGAPALTVVVKGTFDLPAEGVATLAGEQAMPSGEEHFDEDVEQSLRCPSDLDPLKPSGECFVVGSVHSPASVRQTIIELRIGSVAKSLAVYGDRHWRMMSASEPEPFTQLPLRWERSFGGPGSRDNPLGRGLHPDSSGRVALPNFEDPRRLVQSPRDRPGAAGCSPIPRTWSMRTRHAGTYDARWMASRYPGLPEDLDWRFFLAAPEDQRIQGYWRGDEEIQLRHLHPRHPSVSARLPGLRAQAFLVSADGERLTDVGLRLDTIVIDADAGQALCTWRGVTPVPASLDAFVHLFVVHQEPGDRHTLADYEAWYRRALEAEASEEREAEPEDAPVWPELAPAAQDMPTLRAGPELVAQLDAALATRAAQAENAAREEPAPTEPAVDLETPGARWAHLDQAMTVRGDPSALLAAVAEEAARRRAEAKEGAFRPVFEGALGVEVEPRDSGLSAEEQLELEMQSALLSLGGEEPDDARRRVRDAVAAGESCAGWDLSGVDLSGVSLVGGDFRGARLARANLSGAHLRDANFDGATLTEAELSYAVFVSVSFARADISPARAERVRFEGCTLDDATFGDAYLRHAHFQRCSARRADLSSSDLTEARFDESALDEADLSGSQLEAARFTDCTLTDAWLATVKAARAIFERCDTSLLRATDGADLSEASFRKAKLAGARFGGARLEGADLSLSDLGRADLSAAVLSRAQLLGCNLRGARLDGAVLDGASLLKSDLFQARLEGASLQGADLRGANLYQAELWRAELAGARLDLADLTGTRIA